MKISRKPFLVGIMLTFVLVAVVPANNIVKANQKSGIVSIVFDDGWQSQFDNAFPLMQEHNFTGTYYIITSFIGNGVCMNMSDLHAIQDSGSEIGSHTVDHQNLLSLTDEQINNELSASQQLLQANNFSATDLAYPYGASNNHVDSIALQYYRSVRYAYGSGYLMPIPPNPLQMSIPMGFPGETGDSSALAQDESIVDQAVATNSWVVIFFHNILTTPLTDPWEIEQSNFEAFLNYVGNSSAQVLTVNQALNLWSSPQKVTVLPSTTNYQYPYSSVTIDSSQHQTFTASASGGISPYNYEWYLNGNLVGTNSATYDFTSASIGSFSLFANVTDSLGKSIASKSNVESITVNPDLLAPTISASQSAVDQGQVCMLSSPATSTGTPPYDYQWLVKPPGARSYTNINGETSSSYAFVTSSSSAVGIWYFKLQVTDAVSETASSNSVSITVNTQPTVTLSSKFYTLDLGQSNTFSAIATAGSGNYLSYQWYVDTVTQNGQTASTFSYFPRSLGSHQIDVTVTDSLRATSPAFTVHVTVNAPPTVSINPVGPLTMDAGQIQVFTATVNNGSGAIHYQWYLDGSSVGTDSVSYSYTATTAKHSVSCLVTDSASTPVTSPISNIVSVNCNPSLNILDTSNTSASVDQGQSYTFSASISGGTTPYSYQWFQKAAGAKSFTPINGATSNSYLVSTTPSTAKGNWMFEIQVTDAATAAVTSDIFSLQVNSELIVAPPSASSTTLQQNMSTNLTIPAISTGTAPYTYQWYSKAGTNSYAITNVTSPYFIFETSSSTALGDWSFIAQVTDNNGVSVNSTAVTLTIEALTSSPSPSSNPTPSPTPNQTPYPTFTNPALTPQPSKPTATPTNSTTPIPTPTVFITPVPSQSRAQQFPIALRLQASSIVDVSIILAVCGLAIPLIFIKLRKRS